MRRGEQPREKRYTKTRAKSQRKEFDGGRCRSERKNDEQATAKVGVGRPSVSQFTKAVREFGQRRQTFDSKSSNAKDRSNSKITKGRLTVPTKRGLFMQSKQSSVATRAEPLNALNQARKDDNLQRIIQLANSESDNVSRDRLLFDIQEDHHYHRPNLKRSSLENSFEYNNSDVVDEPQYPAERVPRKQHRRREKQMVSSSSSELEFNRSSKFSPAHSSTVKPQHPDKKQSKASARKSRLMPVLVQAPEHAPEPFNSFLSPIAAPRKHTSVPKEAEKTVVDLTSSLDDDIYEYQASYEYTVNAVRDSIVNYHQQYVAKKSTPLQVAKEKLQALHKKTFKKLQLKQKAKAREISERKSIAVEQPENPIRPSTNPDQSVFSNPRSFQPQPTSNTSLGHRYNPLYQETSPHFAPRDPDGYSVEPERQDVFELSNSSYQIGLSPREAQRINNVIVESYSPFVPEEPVITHPIHFLAKTFGSQAQQNYRVRDANKLSPEHNCTATSNNVFSNSIQNHQSNQSGQSRPRGYDHLEENRVTKPKFHHNNFSSSIPPDNLFLNRPEHTSARTVYDDRRRDYYNPIGFGDDSRTRRDFVSNSERTDRHDTGYRIRDVSNERPRYDKYESLPSGFGPDEWRGGNEPQRGREWEGRRGERYGWDCCENHQREAEMKSRATREDSGCYSEDEDTRFSNPALRIPSLRRNVLFRPPLFCETPAHKFYPRRMF